MMVQDCVNACPDRPVWAVRIFRHACPAGMRMLLQEMHVVLYGLQGLQGL